jgi:cytochrome c oxidase assembly factor CtaG
MHLKDVERLKVNHKGFSLLMFESMLLAQLLAPLLVIAP